MVTKKASTFLTDAERAVLRQALKEAETKTSGEIVVAIASDSGRYDRAEDIAGVVTALVLLAVIWLCFQQVVPAAGEWASGPGIALGLPLVMLVIVVGFALGAALAMRVPILRLPFITVAEKKSEIERRAAESFYNYGIGRTAGGTGVLLYVSLYERMVAVKGDGPISQQVDESEWVGICRTVREGFKEGNHAKALAAGIAECGELLARYFPRGANDTNELEDEIHLIDRWEK